MEPKKIDPKKAKWAGLVLWTACEVAVDHPRICHLAYTARKERVRKKNISRLDRQLRRRLRAYNEKRGSSGKE